MAELNLKALYDYYISQGVDPATAAQYAAYYIPYGQKKSFTGITTPKFKPETQLKIEYAPNFTKFETQNDPFWNKIIDVAKKGGTYLDIQKIAYGPDGQAYAEANNLYTPEGYVNTGAILSNAGKILNEYTTYQKQVAKQNKTFDTYASSIGAPSSKARYKFSVTKSYGENEVEYAPIRKAYDAVYAKLKSSLKAAKVSPAEAANYVKQFNTAFETGINAKIAESNLTPFTDYVVRTGGK
jgi:hypothetical protein